MSILVVSVLANLVLALLTYHGNPKSHTNRLFATLVVITIFWLLANYIEFSSTTESLALLSVRIVMFFATAQIYSLFLLVHTFPAEKITLKRPFLLITLFYTIFVMFITLSPYLFTSIKSFDPIPNPIAGPGMVFFALLVVGIFGSTIVLLIKRTLQAVGILRTQLFYLSLGIILTFGLIAISNFLMVLVFNNTTLLPYTPLYTLILVGTTTYAIAKHKLFNVKVVLAGVASVAIVFINLLQVFSAENASQLIFRLVVLVLIAAFSYIFFRSVQNEVKRREEVEGLAKEKTEALTELSERNKNLAALQRISDIVLNESEMKIMAQKILDEIPMQLESCAGALLTIVKDSQLMAYAVSKHQASAKILSLVGGDLEKHIHPVKKDYNLTHAVLVDKEPHDSDSLSDFISPPISKAVALTIQKLIGARHIEAFPLYAGGEPFGVMMFVFTESKDQVHEQNHSIAKAISDDMSLAIQRAQAYQKLKEANAYLADLDKLKDEFISMASHELNTPLAAIEGYLSMVLDEGLGKVDPKAKEYLNRAYDSSKRLAELILDLLNVSRIEQGRLKMKFTKTNFASLVDSVIKELQLKADTKKLYLKLEASKTELPETFCDPDRIREVFVNLIGNSIKFTDKGGITVKLSKPDDHIRAEVVDTGRGIAEADQKLLFQKFSQVKREIDEHQGTGLGLYISKNFVELHKGRIGVESEVGKGAKFFFEIPILKTAPKEVAGAMLDKPVNAAQIESGPKGVPAIVAESSKAKA